MGRRGGGGGRRRARGGVERGSGGTGAGAETTGGWGGAWGGRALGWSDGAKGTPTPGAPGRGRARWREGYKRRGARSSEREVEVDAAVSAAARAWLERNRTGAGCLAACFRARGA